MRSKLILLLFLLLAPMASKAGSQPSDVDFVRVSLITVGPGDEVYALYGHAALRLQCPSHQLDYCFTFEMALTAEEKLKFLFSTAKAGFIAAATPVFFNNYKTQGRSITERQLNLRPTEEQRLWRMLDEEMGRGPHWDYSFLTTNCSSMVVWIVEQALMAEGEHIAYTQLPDAVSGTYAHLLDHLSADYPWARLFWTLRMGAQGRQQGSLNDKLAPPLLNEAWDKASIVDTAGHKRPLFAAPLRQLAPQTAQPQAAWLSPTGALLIITVIIIFIITIVLIKKRKKK